MDDDEAMAILDAAYGHGVRFFDTAEGYGGGRSERLIGRFLASLPDGADRPFVATKIGRGPLKKGGSDGLYAGMREATQGSLERLGVAALDLTQLHCWPQAAVEREAVWEALRRLRDDGLVRHIGASVESVEEARICIRHGAQSLQIIFNIFRQHPRDEFFDEARENGVALIVRLPLASGLLSGKFTKETTFTDDDHRRYNRDGGAFHVGETFAGLPFEKGVELAERVKGMAAARREPARTAPTMAQGAIRWVLDHDAVTVAIPGATRPGQAIDNAAASGMDPLPRESHEALAAFYRDEVQPHVRGQY